MNKHPSPEEIVASLYTEEVIMPPHYMDVRELPEGGKEIKGKLPIGVGQGCAAQVCRTPLIAPKCNENLHKILRPGGKINHLPNMFLAMAQDAAEKDLPSATLAVGLYDDDTRGVLPGQYVAQLWLVIHRMPDEKKVEENVSVPGGR